MERERARKRAYYHQNKGQAAVRMQKYKEAHREQLNTYHRAYRATRLEYYRSYSRAYYWANRDRILAEGKALRAAAKARNEARRAAKR